MCHPERRRAAPQSKGSHRPHAVRSGRSRFRVHAKTLLPGSALSGIQPSAPRPEALAHRPTALSEPFARSLRSFSSSGSRLAMDQSKTPYFQALLDYVDSGVLPFHTPGHVQGNGLDLAFREFVGDNICAIDLTPMPGIDDLLQPLEAIKEAQELAAEAWGADNTFFLINGSTSGNQCMMMAAANPGDVIAVPRNSHKSMLGGLVMSGAIPVYMQPEVDEDLHMDHCVTPETVARTLAEHPEVTAVYIVSPTYYGVAADLRRSRRSRTTPASCCWSTRRGVRTSTSIPNCRSRPPKPGPTSASTRRTRCSRRSRSARCCIRRASACVSTASRRSSRCFSRRLRICR